MKKPLITTAITAAILSYFALVAIWPNALLLLVIGMLWAMVRAMVELFSEGNQ